MSTYGLALLPSMVARPRSSARIRWLRTRNRSCASLRRTCQLTQRNSSPMANAKPATPTLMPLVLALEEELLQPSSLLWGRTWASWTMRTNDNSCALSGLDGGGLVRIIPLKGAKRLCSMLKGDTIHRPKGGCAGGLRKQKSSFSKIRRQFSFCSYLFHSFGYLPSPVQ